ncbi:MAG: hypothetical protein IPJ94_27995 [Chloroflexi bacterium]|nr:hypothetical protein [Chloroflexota bacterium]
MFWPDIKVETTRAKHSIAEVLRYGNWLDDYRRQHPSATNKPKRSMICRAAARQRWAAI